MPGLYSGNLKIGSGIETDATVPIMLKVLPLRLEDIPDIHFAVLYTISPYGQYYRPARFLQLESDVLRFYNDLNSHRMTSISPKCSDWPYKKGSIDGLKAEVRLAAKAGLNGPVLWYMSAMINGTKGGKRYADYDGKCDNWNASRDLARTYFGN